MIGLLRPLLRMAQWLLRFGTIKLVVDAVTWQSLSASLVKDYYLDCVPMQACDDLVMVLQRFSYTSIYNRNAFLNVSAICC